MRSSILATLAGTLAVSQAAAEFSYTATVLQNGAEQPALAAGLEFVPASPLIHLPFRNATIPVKVKGKRSSTVYSTNWCGSVQHIPSGDSFASVLGYFTVPDLSLRSGIGTPQYASTSVGFDGVTCQNVFLLAGASTQISSSGTQTTSVWFDWYPDAAYTLSGVPASPGDWFSVQFTAASALNVKLVINNVSTGYSLTIQLNGTTSLCLEDAAWVASDTSDGVADQLPFAAFSDVWFEGVQATTSKGSTIGATGATLYSLVDSAFQVKCEAVAYDDSDFYVYSTN